MDEINALIRQWELQAGLNDDGRNEDDPLATLPLNRWDDLRFGQAPHHERQRRDWR